MHSPATPPNTSLSFGDLPPLAGKLHFVGIDLAPTDSLETGIATVDRNKNLLWMEKYDTDREIFHYLKQLGPASNTLIALDLPKSLSFDSKWRQQEVKMHPLRVEDKLERFAPRAQHFYQTLTLQGYTVVNFLVPQAKMRYGLNIPFRSRSSNGCRLLQYALKEILKVGNIPTNIAPSSVLDAIIGAYVSWSIYQTSLEFHQGNPQNPELDALNLHKPVPKRRIAKGIQYQAKEAVLLYRDSEQRLYCEPQKLVSSKARIMPGSNYGER